MTWMRYVPDEKVSTAVKVWLLTGLFMIFMQIVIGGVTRLTGSGLSITKWDVVTGAIPPLSAADWTAAFERYQATPQYQKINQGMTLPEFKFIYFWEFFHRFWARLMFFVFIIPFFWFWARGMFSRRIFPRMVVVVLLAGLEGFFGWIMVASGLINRPWVNAYNLTLHLVMALIIFGYLAWTAFIAFQPRPIFWADERKRRNGWILLGIAFLQIALGAMMSGTKAGLFYPSWPDMHGTFLPAVLLDPAQWQGDSFIQYDTNPFMPALVQFLHRNVAYILSIMILVFVWRQRREGPASYIQIRWALLAVLLAQVLLGIFTLINCKGKVPVALGVIHQACAVLLFVVLLLVNFQMTAKNTTAD